MILLHHVLGTTPGEGHYGPTFVDDIPTEVTVSGYVGRNVRLLCRTDSNPKSIITWYKGEEMLEKSRRFKIFQNYMVIKKFSVEDAGQYRCEAVNPFGQIFRDFKVEATEEPERGAGHLSNINEDLTSFKREISNLKKRLDAMTRNTGNIHLHVDTGDTEEQEKRKLEEGQHIFLNILMNKHENNHVTTEGELHGHCEMVHGGGIKGYVHLLQQQNGTVVVDIHLSGFERKDEDSHTHILTVHQNGDLSRGCESVGPIYHLKPISDSPGDNHRRHNKKRHITCDENGEVHMRYTDNSLPLHGTYSVMGRSFVIRDRSEMKIMACCVIGRTDSYSHEMMGTMHTEKLKRNIKMEPMDDSTFYNL